MEYHLRAPLNGPANCLRVPPPFVTDHHTKGQRTGREYTPIGASHVDAVFRRIDLHLVLETSARAVTIDDERGRHWLAVHDALGAEDDGDVRACGGRRDGGPCRLEKRGIRGWHRFSQPSVAR